MRHKKGNAKLNLPTDQRIALLRSLAGAVIEHNQIRTTTVRAKQAKRLIEKLITIAKTNDDQVFAGMRKAHKLLPDKRLLKTLFHKSKIFKTRSGGYTRIIPTGFRRGDATETCILELVETV